MDSTTLCIDQLEVSPLNVRRNEEAATNTASLEASILAEGLLQPLSVHGLLLRPGFYGVFAGGRRYRSIRNLVDRGALPADWPVPVVVHTDAPPVEIVARSLDENLLRRELYPYEQYAALAQEHELGRSAEQLAERHGQTIHWVRQALRLGQLAPPVFAAYEAGTLSQLQAQAFGATADHALQIEAWRTFQQSPDHARTPAAIRAWLRVDDQEEGRLLRFVTEDVYLEAGGAWEPDLFADGADAHGRVTDAGILRQLADEKVAAMKAAAREATGQPELRFVPHSPRSEYGGPDYVLSITPEEVDGRLPLPEGDVVAVLEIAMSGDASISYWWASRRAYNAATRAAASDAKPLRVTPERAGPALVKAGAAIGQQYDGSRQKADAAIREEAGLTKDGIEAMRSIRRSILRAALVRDAREGRSLGRDYLVWAQLRMLVSRTGDWTGTARESDTGMKRIAGTGLEGDGDVARVLIGASEAGKLWGTALAELERESFLTDSDLASAFLDFRAAPEAKRDLAAAIVAGLALERSLAADGYDVPVHDVLAIQGRLALPANVRRWWAPTAPFLRLLPKAEQLAIAEPMMERATFGTWQRLKVEELVPLVLKLVTGKAANVRRSMAAAAADWVHPLLLFRSDVGRRAAEQEKAA